MTDQPHPVLPVHADQPSPVAIIAVSVRRERERAGLSLSELARRAGISKSTLSQLEAGTGNPSVETLWSLGVALGVPFSRFVEPPATQVRVIRADERPRLHSDHAAFAGALLAAGSPRARRDLYVVEAEPGSVRHAEAHLPGTVEHLVVASGRIIAGPEGAHTSLGPGDYLAFRGDVAHSYQGLEAGSWAVLIMEHS